MPISYRIDPSQSLVLTEASGVLTDADVLAHKDRLARDPTFRSSMVELSDIRRVERLEVTREGIAAMVARDATQAANGGRHRLALVVSQDVAFGMARMYQLMGDQVGGAVGVFRTLEEARGWLGID